MSRLLAVCNQKGGVGKTTTTANLAVALGELGYRVLMLDLDPRADLTSAFGLDGERLTATIYEALFDNTVSLLDVAVVLPCCERVTLAPASSHLAAAELLLVQRAPGQRERVVAQALEPVREAFDFVLMDTPPGLNLLAINALAAAGEVLAPQQCSFIALHGLRQLDRTIAGVREGINPGLRWCGIVATMRDSRTIHHREVLALMREAFGGLLFETVIPASIRFQEAPVAALPVVTYAPHSPGAIAYMALAKEILHRAQDPRQIA